MTIIRTLKKQFAAIGYSAIVDDYSFSDVFAKAPTDRKAPVAAFTHTPPSYRNAALAVVECNGRSAIDIVAEFRALGAPLIFSVEGDTVSVWQTRSESGPRELMKVAASELADLFMRNRDDWKPLAIQRAKSIGQFEPQYQLGFVDLGLIPAIEGQIHLKLDRLLNEAMADAIDSKSGVVRGISSRSLFRAVFRFLTAKILQDRLHPVAQQWDVTRVETVLKRISHHYKLPAFDLVVGSREYRILQSVWKRLLQGLNFQNISADDLAFVYENTLVTPEIRKTFGTHSTPRQVAEYVVRNLGLHEFADRPEKLHIYEPFAGAAVLLTSALRHLRELLPLDWTDHQRHSFLVKQMAGDEIDMFGCEVANLSLILADYPSHNGWHIKERDLFEKDVLATEMAKYSVILCNPPFEAFNTEERETYPIAKTATTKASAVLAAAIDAQPLALGFVLPRAFILEKQFAQHRAKLETLYGSVELVELPDRIFHISKVETALLIAKHRRPQPSPSIRIRSASVADSDGAKFLQTGEVTATRELTRAVTEDPKGDLWIPELSAVWRYLRDNPKLGSKLIPSRGLEWTYGQALAAHPRAGRNRRRGLHNATQLNQFAARPVFLDFDEKNIRRGYDQSWDMPKIVMNASRFTRGAWRIGAYADFDGLVYSQQFYGLWPKATCTRSELLALAAILNGPVANAFVGINSPSNRFRKGAIENLPLPFSIPEGIDELVEDYSKSLDNKWFGGGEASLEILHRIDAAVLKAYDLSPKLERELLEYFRRANRPTVHPWSHWLPEDFGPFIRLHEMQTVAFRRASEPWTQKAFKPLPQDLADALTKYMD